MKLTFLYTIYILTLSTSQNTEIHLKWTYPVGSNLYAPPLLCDVRDSPGLEVIISDSEGRALKCISSKGELLWNFAPNWAKRLTSTASFLPANNYHPSLLVIGNPDGTLLCIDGQNATPLWKRKSGPIEWTNPVWIKSHNENETYLLAPGEKNGIDILNFEGKLVRQISTQPPYDTPLSSIPIAAGDVDHDDICEIFFPMKTSLFCYDLAGNIKWQFKSQGELVGGASIGILKKNCPYDIVCVSKNPHLLYLIDATNGILRANAPLISGPELYGASSIALGDVVPTELDQNEIVVGDSEGHIYCFSADAELLWMFLTHKRAPAYATLADIDDDGLIDVLVGCSDHFLYCLDSYGNKKWEIETDLRIVHPPSIADIDEDGKVDILIGSCDGQLRCFTTFKKWDPQHAPWPSKRYDTSQSGFQKIPTFTSQRLPIIEETQLLKNPEFRPKYTPEDQTNFTIPGWQFAPVTSNTLKVISDADQCYRIEIHAVDQAVSIMSEPVELNPNITRIHASVFISGEEASAQVVWLGDKGFTSQQLLKTIPAQNLITEENKHFHYLELLTPKPTDAKAVYLEFVTPRGVKSIWYPPTLVLRSRSKPTLQILVNQIGYDLGAPKHFLVQSNFIPQNASFSVIMEDNQIVFSAPLHYEGRIVGAYNKDWGWHYWKGDFSSLNQPGKYHLSVEFDQNYQKSLPFEIGENLIWDRTSALAYRFFYYQRCGTDIPGFHKACHLDDAVSQDENTQFDLTGGWHDAGDYNKYHNAPYLLGLTNAYLVATPAFNQQDANLNGIADLFEELLWAAEHVQKMIAPDGSAFGLITSGYAYWGPPERETDNIPGTHDERKILPPTTGHDPAAHGIALALLAPLDTSHKAIYIKKAKQTFEWRQKRQIEDKSQFTLATLLYELTNDLYFAEIAKHLKNLFLENWLETTRLNSPEYLLLVDTIQRYDTLFHEDHIELLKIKVKHQAQQLLQQAKNPFGIFTFGTEESPNFFNTPSETVSWHIGTNGDILNAAAGMTLAYKFVPESVYLEFIYNQLNWIFGVNPFGLCMMEGVGTVHLPTYHNRLRFAGIPRGAVPGGIVNGITYKNPGDDRPFLDLSGVDIPSFESNEFWLPHNTAYLQLLARLYSLMNAG